MKALVSAALLIIIHLLSVFPQAQANGEVQSFFFRNDPTAQSILSGTPYLMQENNYFIEGGGGEKNPASFEFKFLNALRQLGFNNLSRTKNVGDTAVNVDLNKFQAWHNLPQSDYVDIAVFQTLDAKLATKEQTDKATASLYDPFAKFIESPPNEPAKEHLAALYANFFSALPPSIETNTPGEGAVASIDQFRVSLSAFRFKWLGRMLDPQSLVVLDDQQMQNAVNSRADFRYCAMYYFAAYQKASGGLSPADCTRLDKPYDAGTEDFGYMSFQAHEYGHGVGLKDDRYAQFGSISFEGYDVLKRPENAKYEFISKYAQTNYAEDFAESFATYIHMGRIFRKLAADRTYLQQKYNYLKHNIFSDIEYDTGNLDSLNRWWSEHDDIPDNFQQYLTDDATWIWDYTYSILTPPLSLPGDVNRDGRVDFLDIHQLLAGFSNIFDYNEVVTNFGKTQ